jgi:hypothetical protein
MRDCRNVLRACRAVARKKQKHHCDGVGKRVRANFQGVSDTQKRAGTIGPVANRKGPRPASAHAEARKSANRRSSSTER